MDEIESSALVRQDGENARTELLEVALAGARAARLRAQESELRFRATADSAPILIWKAGIDGLCAWFNAPWLAFTGRSMDEELGHGWIAGVHPDDVGRVLPAQRAAIDAREVFQLEFRLRRHDGKYRWVLSHGSPRFDEVGAFVGYIGSSIDITDQRVARERTEALQELSADLTRGLTRNEVTEVAMRHLVRSVGASASGIVELTEDGREFVLLGSVGHADDVKRRFSRYPVDAALPVRDVMRTHDGVFVESLAEWTATYAGVPALADAAADGSWVALPLLVDDRMLGAITMSLPQARTIPDDERRFMRAFADLCAQALDRARLFETERSTRISAQRAAERIAALQAMTSELGDARTIQAVGDVIMRLGLGALGASRGSIALMEDNGTHLSLCASYGYPAEIEQRFQRMPLDAPIPFCDCVRTRSTIFLHTRAAREAQYPHLDTSRLPDDNGGLAAMPLWNNGRVVGSMGVVWLEPRTFDQGERDFLRAVADQTAQSLERARLNEAEQSAREASTAAQERAEFLAEATRLLASSLDYEATLTALAEAVVPKLADWCAIDMLVDASTATWPPQIEQVVVTHVDPARVAWARESRNRHGIRWDAPIGVPEVLRTGGSNFLPRVTDAMIASWGLPDHEVEMARELQLTSVLCVPLSARGRTLGVLTLCMAESERHFDPNDRALAEELGQRAATAVENSRLLSDAEAARREAEDARRAAEEARAAADDARDAAEAANRAKAEFLTIMSHELRTPLNAIGGYASLMELGIRGPVTAEQTLDLARIQRSQRHLLGMINEVLNYARLESGSVQFNIETVHVTAAFASVEPLVLPQAEAKGLTLGVDACDDRIATRADEEKLQQILVNLLSNAVKFTPRGGRVMMSCSTVAASAEHPTAMVRIVVQDTGMGIPAEQLQSVFEPFVQLGRSRYAPGEGAGLGLAISRDLARGMGGDLSGESEVGRGSTFTLTLPAAER